MLDGRGLALSAVALLCACAAEGPEAAFAQLVEAAEAAAESRDTGYFRGLLANGYSDSRGNDRQRLIGLIRGYFLANPSVEVFTRLETVELHGDDAAELVVLAGVLGREPGGGLFEGLDGRLYRLELELVENGGEWQVIGARWNRSPDAFIGE